jgi:predicted transcriptional regulator
MQQTSAYPSSSSIELTSEIVSAYVSNNRIPLSELPNLIDRVHTAVSGIVNRASENAIAEIDEKATPAQIRKSITPDYLVSFIDGKPYKTLKRHLAGHGLDPYGYRERYGLPRDYPMVAANYAAQRSALAISIRLGQIDGQQTKTPKPLTRRKTA